MLLEDIKSQLRDSGQPSLELNAKYRSIVYKTARDQWNRSLSFSLSKLLCPKIAIMAAVRELEQEILPRLSDVNIKSLLKENGITPTEIFFLCHGFGSLEPYKVVRASTLMDKQDDFWLAGHDLAFYDESFSWLMEIRDDGQVLLSKRP